MRIGNCKLQIERAPWVRVLDGADGPLLIKHGLDDSQAAVARSALYHEQRILQRLEGVAGCPRLVRFDPVRRELAVADFGGVPLSESELLGHLDLERFLALSEALAGIVAAIHGHGVIHKNLNPANILIRPDERRAEKRKAESRKQKLDRHPVQVIGFDLATTFAEEHPEFDHPSRLSGFPAYLSPEQTGRMNRLITAPTSILWAQPCMRWRPGRRHLTRPTPSA